MFKVGPKYIRLKADLQLTCHRLVMLQKKKTELVEKLKKEIASCLQKQKIALSAIKAQSLVKREASIEAMELVEMFCEQILDRYGIFEEKKVDEDFETAVASLIWVCPYMQSEVRELKPILKQLRIKYGSEFAKMALKNKQGNVSPELINRFRLSITNEKVHECLNEIVRKYDIKYDIQKKIDNHFLEGDKSDQKHGSRKKVVHKKNFMSSPSNALNVIDGTEVFEGYGTHDSVPDKIQSPSFARDKRKRRFLESWKRRFFLSHELPTMQDQKEDVTVENDSKIQAVQPLNENGLVLTDTVEEGNKLAPENILNELRSSELYPRMPVISPPKCCECNRDDEISTAITHSPLNRLDENMDAPPPYEEVAAVNSPPKYSIGCVKDNGKFDYQDSPLFPKPSCPELESPKEVKKVMFD